MSYARQRGAALLMAMLTVALVATLAAGALWQQWRSVEIETSERSRAQAGWILTGALDWARLILREDARTGGADHLGEPWSIPLSESRLSTFLAMDSNHSQLPDEVFLSGQITDAQSRMNFMNLVTGGKVSEPDMQAFKRLFEQLGLDPSELEQAAANLVLATGSETAGGPAAAASAPVSKSGTPIIALLPQRVEQLRWLGLSAASLQRLGPFITVLPVHAPLNLNTASAEAISASIPDLELGDARRLVTERERRPFRSLAAAGKVISASTLVLNSNQVSIATRFFEVRGRLRMESMVVEERSLVQRNGMSVTVLWRERAALEPVGLPQRTDTAATGGSGSGSGLPTMPP